MIQVRNVPETLHRELCRRAKARKQTLTAHVQEVLEREIARASPDDEIWERIDNLPRRPLGISPADLIREVREEMENKWDSWLLTPPSLSPDSSNPNEEAS